MPKTVQVKDVKNVLQNFDVESPSFFLNCLILKQQTCNETFLKLLQLKK